MRANTTIISTGLLLAWLANDIEELVTMKEDSRRTLSAAPERLPVPQVLREQGVSQAHVTTAISMMGGIMAVAAIDGMRTEGRSKVFQTSLMGFGLHGFGHLANAALSGRWTSGARTSPTVVIPYWLLASLLLRRAGIDPTENVSWRLLASGPLLLVAVHGAAWVLRRALGTRRPLVEG